MKSDTTSCDGCGAVVEDFDEDMAGMSPAGWFHISVRGPELRPTNGRRARRFTRHEHTDACSLACLPAAMNSAMKMLQGPKQRVVLVDENGPKKGKKAPRP